MKEVTGTDFETDETGSRGHNITCSPKPKNEDGRDDCLSASFFSFFLAIFGNLITFAG